MGSDPAGGEVGKDVFLANRVRFHLVYRLAGRLYQLGAARSNPEAPRWRSWAALGCAAVDVAGAAWLKRSPGPTWVLRLVVDAADAALWSSGADLHPDMATLPGVPFATEAGVRAGVKGLAVPIAGAAAASLTRRLRGLPARPGAFGWQAVGVGFGAGLAAYEARHRRALTARHAQGLQAELGRAHHDGQHAVAMTADSVVDLVIRTTPLLGSRAQGMSAGLMAEWKAALAEAAGTRATYLGTALAAWESAYNRARPELAANAALNLAEGEGTVLLTAEQSTRLSAALDALRPRGKMEVGMADSVQARLPGRPRDLVAGGYRISLPADRRDSVAPVDVGPVVLAFGAVWWADLARPVSGGASRLAAGLAVADTLALAAWTHRRLHQRGTAAHGEVLLVGLLASAINTVIVSPSMRVCYAPDGVQNFPFLSGFTMASVLTPLYWRDLEPRQKATTVGLVALIGSIGIAMLKAPLDWPSLVLELLWPTAGLLSMWPLPQGLTLQAEALAASLARNDGGRVSEAYERGRSEVTSLVSRARQELGHALEECRPDIHPELAAEADRRLAEIDHRLGVLACQST